MFSGVFVAAPGLILVLSGVCVAAPGFITCALWSLCGSTWAHPWWLVESVAAPGFILAV